MMVAYHDEEWGVPIHDDRRWYEKLTLDGAQAGLSWLTILRKRAGRGSENLREIDDSMASDGEGEFGLAFAGAFDAYEDEGAGIENCGERGDPGLIVMLRTKIGEHGIGEMAFHEFRGPPLPILEKSVQRVLAIFVAVATKKFAGCRWRAGAGIE